MSYYTTMCATGPGKRFIEPGSEKSGHPRHTVTGMGEAGVAEAAALDADHPARPLGLNTRTAQQRMLDRALEIIRERVPGAVTVDLCTSDQGRYGFVLDSIQDVAGSECLPAWDDFTHPLAGLGDDVAVQLNDLDWDGVVGEGHGGYVTLNVVTGDVVSSS
jgi:hypothetical protein